VRRAVTGGTFQIPSRYLTMAPHPIRHALTSLGVLTAHPISFVIFAVFVCGWVVFSRETLEWHAIATLATWFMTLVIQRAEHRDTQAIHAKLDELLRANDGARNELQRVDEKDAEEIEEGREQAQGRAPA
jgi:low affinity Fe/Cu permease